MKGLGILSLLAVSFFLGCVTTSATDRSTDEAMLNFMPYLNQKVAGYISANEVKTLDASNYKEIVEAVCSPLPSCRGNMEILFKTYAVDVRMVDSMFSVMLCDKERRTKNMEDFSCNESEVEIPSFQIDPEARCTFEVNWKERLQPFCPHFKEGN